MTHAISARYPQTMCSAWPAKCSPSAFETLQPFTLIAGSVATGLVGWSGHPLSLPISCLFPLLWASSPSRITATLVSLGYFAAASHGLAQGAATFFNAPSWTGIFLWLTASIPFVIVHTTLWTNRRNGQSPLRYALALLLMSLPPFGILGWASPLTAAGILFPEWGWLGLAMTLAGLLTLTSRFWPCALSVFSLAFVIAGLTWTPPEPPEGWTGINTTFGDGTSQSLYQQQLETLHRVHEAQKQGASFILLPENSFDLWTTTTGKLWQRELHSSDVTVIGGTSVLQTDETTDETYDNGLMQVSATGSRILYRQRMPVPISMWHPWARGGAKANMFDNPTFTLADQTMAALICYEQLLIWPVLHSMLFRPDILLAPSNAWWTNNSNIADIQTAATQSWARLFGVKLVTAVNR